MIDEWFGLGILRPICNMDVDLVLRMVAVAGVAEVYWSALADEECFLYDFAQSMPVFRIGDGAMAAQKADKGDGE